MTGYPYGASIVLKEFKSPFDLIFHTLPFRMVTGPELEVLGSIILPVPVDVVDCLVTVEMPSKNSFHDLPVLENPAAGVSIGMPTVFDHNVAVYVDIPTSRLF